ncbi:MAG: tetratricopeptide repeat protein [Polyangiaceae bacterium]
MTARQHRALLARGGDFPAAAEIMEAELRRMQAGDGRAHTAWLSAEVARLVQRDDQAAKKRTEQAMRSLPSDPRPGIQRFCEVLARNVEPTVLAKFKPSDPEALASLGLAAQSVAAMRGLPPAKGAPAAGRHVVELLHAVRAAFAAGSIQGVVTQATPLLRTSFAGAARAGSSGRSRAPAPRHAATPSARSARPPRARPPCPRDALAALATELGEAVDARNAAAFSPTDRIALAALAAAQPHPGGLAARETLATVLDEAAVEAGSSDLARDVALLTGPVVAALMPQNEQRLARLRFVQAGGPGTRAAVMLGRTLGLGVAGLASTEGAFRELVDASMTDLVSAADPLRPEWAALLRVLGLELDAAAGATDRVAQTVATWGGDAEQGADAAGMLAASLLAELAGDAERASATYAEVHRTDPSCESVARIASAATDPATFTRLLRDHADLLAPSPTKAILYTECAIRFASLAAANPEAPDAGLSDEGESATKIAAELQPDIPIAAHIGEISARARNDQDGLLEWLRFRRQASEDPVERAHDLVREALLLSDSDGSSASSLLEQALRARPNDFGLRDLYERLSHEPPPDRAEWREARAQEMGVAAAGPSEGGDEDSPKVGRSPDGARLAIEAALEFERAGDLEAASRCIKLAEGLGENAMSPIASYRFALSGFGTAELVDALLPQARSTEDAATRLEIYERLAELDERGRNDTASALLFRRTILEEKPSDVRTLRRVASALMAGGREEELEPIAMELARNLEGGEAVAYAAVAARLRLRTSWEETAEPVAVAFAQQPRPLWALRAMVGHARARGDMPLIAQCSRELLAMTDRGPERAALSLRAAEALRSSADLTGARELLEEAVSLVPHHIVARLTLASVLEDLDEPAEAANQLEAAAETITGPEWQRDVLYRAALLWQEKVGDADKTRAALERVAALDPNNVEVFERLRQVYVAAGARSELAELLRRRLDAIEDPAERVEMEVMRGRALAEVGDGEAAKRALAAALDANPDHIEALSAFVDLCFDDGDYDGAEQALIRLARLATEPDKQVEIYFRLGALYDTELPNDERADLAYQEILKRRPNDEKAREKLIALYRRTNQLQRAVDEQTALVNAAENQDDKCKRTVELAEILEQAGEQKKAESTLVVARKSFPKSDLALRALVGFYQRTGQAPAAAVMLDRAVADARRALGTGRFEVFLFETLATAAELRNREDAALVARAAVLAIDGDATEVAGVGLSAGDAGLDDLLAPEVMTPAFRDLLLRTGNMLDVAFPYDFDGVRAAPTPSLSDIADEVQEIASAYGLNQVSVLVSSVLGSVCVPARAHPPTVVMGQTLANQAPSAERTFLIHRAMKVLQANAAVIARTAPIDLWPVLAAYLRVHSPQFSPQGVDAARFSEAFGRLSRALPAGLPSDTGVLAADVIGSIGNRASTLNAAINGWGSRAGLLAVGDPNVALNGIAWAGGNANGPPPNGKDRLTWIGRNAEARDLIIFSVSDAYVDARSRLIG